MSGLTYAQMFTFSKTIHEILSQNKDLFVQAGLDVDKKMKPLTEKNDVTLESDARQEKLKSELTEATKKSVEAAKDSYRLASDTTQAMIGVLGKDDPLSKRLRKLREQMKKVETRGVRKTKGAKENKEPNS